MKEQKEPSSMSLPRGRLDGPSNPELKSGPQKTKVSDPETSAFLHEENGVSYQLQVHCVQDV